MAPSIGKDEPQGGATGGDVAEVRAVDEDVSDEAELCHHKDSDEKPAIIMSRSSNAERNHHHRYSALSKENVEISETLCPFAAARDHHSCPEDRDQTLKETLGYQIICL